MRYFIQFSYAGTSYHGWQKQPNANSVQETLESALSMLLKETIALMGAGRTDTGVHAREMFAHFDSSSTFNKEELVKRLNAFLDDSIAIQKIISVTEDAHARFDATSRTYEYWIVQHKDPFLFDWSHFVRHPLDIDKMNHCANLLLAHEDFQCFSKSNTDVHTYLCDVQYAKWEFIDNRLVFTIKANRFLRNMVRAIVGTLIEVGIAKLNEIEFADILNSKDRSEAGPSVPAKGLYLTSISYPYI